jgi:dTMP kinase
MISIIVALTENRVIGKDNKLLWHIPDDLKNFKRVTDGSTVIMGLNTFYSIGKPLPNRNNIVLSKDPQNIKGVDVCLSIPEAIEKAKSYRKEIFIIGGAMVYKQFLPIADRLYLSFVKKKYEGDAFFPEFDINEWDEIERKPFDDFDFVVYERKSAGSSARSSAESHLGRPAKGKKGKLIVLCGTDGSGKATQTKLLLERLRKEGHDVEAIDFPQYGRKSAALAEDYLNGVYGSAEEVGPYRASIFFACDRYAASFQIRKWLDERKIVICNRYVSANQGHQAGKIKNLAERDKFLEWLDDLEYNIFGIPKPDVNILLYMPCELGQMLVDKKEKRDYIEGQKRDIHEADLKHLKAAEEAYIYAAKKYGWLRIDCNEGDNPKTIEEIHELVWARVKEIIVIS